MNATSCLHRAAACLLTMLALAAPARAITPALGLLETKDSLKNFASRNERRISYGNLTFGLYSDPTATVREGSVFELGQGLTMETTQGGISGAPSNRCFGESNWVVLPDNRVRLELVSYSTIGPIAYSGNYVNPAPIRDIRATRVAEWDFELTEAGVVDIYVTVAALAHHDASFSRPLPLETFANPAYEASAELIRVGETANQVVAQISWMDEGAPDAQFERNCWAGWINYASDAGHFMASAPPVTISNRSIDYYDEAVRLGSHVVYTLINRGPHPLQDKRLTRTRAVPLTAGRYRMRVRTHIATDGGTTRAVRRFEEDEYHSRAEVALTFEADTAAPEPGKVVNASRTGSPQGGVHAATVNLLSSGVVTASAVTALDGTYAFADPAPDLTILRDVGIERGYADSQNVPHVLQRRYHGVRLQGEEDVDTIMLPLNLHNSLQGQLKRLSTSGPLNFGYDVAGARTLTTNWGSSTTPRTAFEHKERDEAMGRLLSATETMAMSYDAAEAVAMDGAKMMANVVISFLSAKEVVGEVEDMFMSQLASQALHGSIGASIAQTAGSVAGAMAASIKVGLEISKDSFLDSLKKKLNEPWVSAVDLLLTTAIGGMTEAVSDGSWDRSKLNQGGMGDLLELLAETAAEQIGGRVLAKAYVEANQEHYNSAVTRAENREGNGTVAEGLVAAWNKAIAIEKKADDATSLSKAVADTAKGWGQVADVAQAAGNIPGLQEAKAVAYVIQGMGLTAIASAVAKDFITLHAITYTDTPLVPVYAFFPTGVVPPSASPPPSELSGESGVSTSAMGGSAAETDEGEESSGMTAPPPSGDYAAALSALRARIVAGNRAGVETDVEAVLTAHETLAAAIQAVLQQVRTQATTASPPRPALSTAQENLSASAGSLFMKFGVMYADLLGWLVPELASPEMTQPGLLAEIDAVLAAITVFHQAQGAAETEAAGLVTPAYVVTSTHGVAEADPSGRIQPGAATLRARVTNTGSQTATGFTAELTAVDPAAPVAVLQITSAGTQALADLAPGESRTLTWNVLLTDISTNGTGSGTAYTITLSGAGGVTDVESGGIRVITALNTEPLLTLNGANPLVMDARASYTDAGATAHDFQDGLLTPVLTGNNVRPAVPGSYTVTYSATDSQNLSSTITRNVQVVASEPPAIAAPAGGFTPLNLVAGDVLPDYTGQAVVSDNATEITVTQIPAPGTVVNAGTLAVTLTARDGAGSEASLSFDVTIAAAPADTGIFSGDFPRTPLNMWWHNDFTAHPTNGWLYGTCARGGIHDNGMIFRVNEAGDYQTLVHFTSNGLHSKGREPAGRMALGADGNFYGATVTGGSLNVGTIFKMTPEGALTTLVNLTGNGGVAMGAQPYGGLVAGPDGHFYGTTQYGGSGDIGSIFKVTAAGGFTTLVSFTGNGASNKGSFPNGTLTLGADGEFYGMTGRGGAANRGTIFKVTTAGVLTTLLEFSGNGASNKGGEPWGSLTLGADGDFYGLTSQGGAGNVGTAFKVTPAGLLTTLVEFTDSSAPSLGRYPFGDLLTGADGVFYGVTSEGGADGSGTVFKLTAGGVLTTLVEFTENDETNKGRRPKGSLALGTDGCFYGTTELGGDAGKGTVFKVTPSGVLTTFIESTTFFRGATAQGAYPNGAVCAGPDGTLYGTTYQGGYYDKGTIFKVNAAGQRTVLVHFSGTGSGWPGANPRAGLVLAGDGNFYGTTQRGGEGNLGTVFRVTPTGVHATLVSFTGTSGAFPGSYPWSRLSAGPDGHLYAVTSEGGSSNMGVAFRITTDGVFTKLLDFTGVGGANPGSYTSAPLTLGPDGAFYSAQFSGGNNDYGTIYKMTTAGVMTVLKHLDSTTGGWPCGAPAFGPDGLLYGMTNDGGTSDFGTVYKVTTTGAFMKLIDFSGFTGATRGAWPLGALFFAPDGFFYGATNSGGANDMGVLFRMTTGGTMTVLADFKGAGSGIESGGWPYNDEFTIRTDGRLYGMTSVGGRQGGGLIYHVPMLSPEIAVHGNGADIAEDDGTPSLEDHTQFGLAALTAASITRTFTIHNSGTAALTLGSVLISGAHGADFTVSAAPAASVAPGSSTTLGITFDPSAAGARTAHVSISTNDHDENPFGFFISGIGNSGPLFAGLAFITTQGAITSINETMLLLRTWDIDGQTLTITSVAATSAEGAGVSRNGGVIIYTPPTDFVGIDTFTVTLSDGLVIIDGTITMNVNADPGLNPSNPPQLSAQPGGVMRLVLTGTPGRIYGIQRSTDLINWTQIATTSANELGTTTFDDPAPPQFSAFYRIIFPAEESP